MYSIYVYVCMYIYIYVCICIYAYTLYMHILYTHVLHTIIWLAKVKKVPLPCRESNQMKRVYLIPSKYVMSNTPNKCAHTHKGDYLGFGSNLGVENWVVNTKKWSLRSHICPAPICCGFVVGGNVQTTNLYQVTLDQKDRRAVNFIL